MAKSVGTCIAKGLSIRRPVLVLVVNLLLRRVVQLLGAYEKHPTTDEQELSLFSVRSAGAVVWRSRPSCFLVASFTRHASCAVPGPESSILKLKGTNIQQRTTKLTTEAGGLYSAAWGGKPGGPNFAREGMAGYLASRAYTIYGGASEVQRDVIAKNVLGIKRSGK